MHLYVSEYIQISRLVLVLQLFILVGDMVGIARRAAARIFASLNKGLVKQSVLEQHKEVI